MRSQRLAESPRSSVTAVDGLPEVVPGDDLAALIATAIEA